MRLLFNDKFVDCRNETRKKNVREWIIAQIMALFAHDGRNKFLLFKDSFLTNLANYATSNYEDHHGCTHLSRQWVTRMVFGLPAVDVWEIGCEWIGTLWPRVKPRQPVHSIYREKKNRFLNYNRVFSSNKVSQKISFVSGCITNLLENWAQDTYLCRQEKVNLIFYGWTGKHSGKKESASGYPDKHKDQSPSPFPT